MSGDHPLQHRDMPGLPWEERMARLAADRAHRARLTEAAEAEAEREAVRQAHATLIATLPTPTHPGRCGHGAELCRPWPPDLAWAGGVTECVCCKTPFGYVTSCLMTYTHGVAVTHGGFDVLPLCDQCTTPGHRTAGWSVPEI